MNQMRIDTQIGDTLIDPLIDPLGELTNRDKNMFFYFYRKHYKVLISFRLKKYY